MSALISRLALTAAVLVAFGCSSNAGSKATASDIPREFLGCAPPSGVDPALFQSLKQKLADELAALGPRARRVSAPPTQQAGTVTDLSYNPGANELSWTYRNGGDYDMNGEVGVADITPIALNFQADSNDGAGDDALESWIDGDGSGEVGVSDITPIALNFLGVVDHYDILTSDSASGPFTEIATVPFSSHLAGTVPPQFSVVLPGGAQDYVAVRPGDAENAEGPASVAVNVTGAVIPPEIISIDPLAVDASSAQVFSAEITGTAPFAYSWTFGGACDPPTSTEAEPHVTITGFTGSYNASLFVSNAAGSDTFPFVIQVVPLHGEQLTKLFFLHHSTGSGFVFEGNMRGRIAEYNAEHGTSYTFCDHGYNGEYFDENGDWQDISYEIPGDNTDPDGLHYLWTSQNADAVFSRNMILDNHEVIAFKSCFPAAGIESEAQLEQYKTWYLEMRDFFDTRRDKLFIVMGFPPLHRLSTDSAQAARARAFANWLSSGEYLGSAHPNLLCFNVFDQLAEPDGPSPTANMLRSEYEISPTDGDSHPNTWANQNVGAALANFMCGWAEIYQPPG
ncbi:MAG: PKD domain-containing protein [bacterium]|jgi:hypothetical protein